MMKGYTIFIVDGEETVLKGMALKRQDVAIPIPYGQEILPICPQRMKWVNQPSDWLFQ